MASIDRQILTGPDWVARAAAGALRDPRARWMLRQTRAVRLSYASEVYGRADEETCQQKWMLLQPEEIRRSYIEHVLSKPRRHRPARDEAA